MQAAEPGKAGKLDADEWEAMKPHAAHTESILKRIAAFGELAAIAGARRERLDGKGYPRGVAGDALALAIETRIITTADILGAPTAERPYRAALPRSLRFRRTALFCQNGLHRR
jgi:HD-GYP domain-containing protein (c-di-GMP phosphodiesterase class II)